MSHAQKKPAGGEQARANVQEQSYIRMTIMPKSERRYPEILFHNRPCFASAIMTFTRPSPDETRRLTVVAEVGGCTCFHSDTITVLRDRMSGNGKYDRIGYVPDRECVSLAWHAY